MLINFNFYYIHSIFIICILGLSICIYLTLKSLIRDGLIKFVCMYVNACLITSVSALAI